jgi:hypothetical protein
MFRRIAGRRVVMGAIGVLVAVGVLSISYASSWSSSAAVTKRPPAGPPSGAPHSLPARLSAPKTSTAADGKFFIDLAQADPNLASYVDARGNVALRALLTDGSAFCAFLHNGGGVDNAMTSVVIGARSVEPQTHLPMTVATFNAIDAVALLTLCPTEQTLLPRADQARIRKLGEAL